MATQGINGTAVGIVVVGSLLAYSGLKGKKFSVVTRDFIAGKDLSGSATDASLQIAAQPLPAIPDAAFQGRATGNVPNTNSIANNRKLIIDGLRSIGANNYTIAGILGGFRVESGVSSTAYNANENAIGFAQWEGGRRVALQNFARAHGMTETDPRAQVGYLLQELTGPYANAFRAAQASGSASNAAAIIDAQYEVSSGEARGQRIMYAIQEYLALMGGGGR